MTDTPKFFTSASEFSLHIEDMVVEHKISHFEALVKFVADSGVEESTVRNMLSESLKQKVYEEACKTHRMPKMTTSKLDDC